jgi:hypothetical protein
LRDELLASSYAKHDSALFDIVISADRNGANRWLDAKIDEDTAARPLWRRRRAIRMMGFRTNNALPQSAAWPSDRLRSNVAELEVKGARMRFYEACSHHWWSAFLEGIDLAEAER